MNTIVNAKGEIVTYIISDAEAVRFWREYGEPGDRLGDTGELMSEVDKILGLEP